MADTIDELRENSNQIGIVEDSCAVNGLETQLRKQKCRNEKLQKTNMYVEMELSKTIDKNEILEKRIQRVICQNEKLKTLSTEKEELECKNEELTYTCCTLRKDQCVLKETLAGAERRLQETKSTLERETCLRGKLDKAYEQLRDECARVRATLETTDTKLACAEQKLRAASAKLDKEMCENKKLNEQNGELEDKCTRAVEKCDKMAATVCCTEQKLNDAVSRLRDEIRSKEQLEKESAQLKRERACLDKKLNDAEQRLQATVLKLQEEIDTKGKINEELIKLKELYSCVRKKLEDTTERNLQNEESCKSKHVDEKQDRLSRACESLKNELDGVKDKLNEVTCSRQKMCEQHAKLKQELMRANGDLEDAKRELCTASSRLAEENRAKDNDLSDECARVNATLENTERMLAGATRTIAALNDQICSKNEEIGRSHDECSCLREKLTDVRRQLTRAERELACVNRKSDDTERRLREAQSRLDEQTRAKNELRAKYDRARDELGRAERTLAAAVAKLNEETSERTIVGGKCDRLTGECARLHKVLDDVNGTAVRAEEKLRKAELKLNELTCANALLDDKYASLVRSCTCRGTGCAGNDPAADRAESLTVDNDRLVRLNGKYHDATDKLEARLCARDDANNCCERHCDPAPSDCGRCAPRGRDGNGRRVAAVDNNTSSCVHKSSPRPKPSACDCRDGGSAATRKCDCRDGGSAATRKCDCRDGGSAATRTCDSCSANAAKTAGPLRCRTDEANDRFGEQVAAMQRTLTDMERNTVSRMERLRQQYDKETDELNARLKTYETTKVREAIHGRWDELQLRINRERAGRRISNGMDVFKQQLADVENGLKSGKPKPKPVRTPAEDCEL